MWRIEFTNETCKKMILSIFLTKKGHNPWHTQGTRILFCLFTVRGLTFQMDVSLHKLRWANSGNVGEEKSLNSAEIENFCIQLIRKDHFAAIAKMWELDFCFC